MEVIDLAGIATLLVPISNQSLGPELTIEVRGLLDDEVLVHQSYNYYLLSQKTHSVYHHFIAFNQRTAVEITGY